MKALEAALAAARKAYFAEVEALADELRPRFESGELRGWWPDDTDVYVAPGQPWPLPPLHKLEKICARHFGRSRALALLSAACAHTVEWDTWTAPKHFAGNAVARDVLAVARRRGWVAPVPKAKPKAA